MSWIAGKSPISFPNLGIDIDPMAGFTLGPLRVNFYGLIIALGMVLAILYAWKRREEFGIKENDLTDGLLWIIPFSILCARLYYCVFKWDMYRDNPISVLYIWSGGLAIYGAVIGAAVGIVVHSLVRKIRIPALLDLISLGFLIGQCLGRWGNFFNREAYGAQTDSFLKMGLYLTEEGRRATAEFFYHPTFLYESVWNALGFALLHFLSKKRQYDGQIALGYAAWYGLGRMLIEGLRTDSLYWGPFRVSQLLAAVTCVAAVAVLLMMAFRPHDRAKLCVNRLAAAEAEDPPTETQE